VSRARWAIETRLCGGEWINPASEGEDDSSYATRAEAREELREHIKSMRDAGMDFNARDWRVGKVQP
jgi:hypothetical protein